MFVFLLKKSLRSRSLSKESLSFSKEPLRHLSLSLFLSKGSSSAVIPTDDNDREGRGSSSVVDAALELSRQIIQPRAKGRPLARKKQAELLRQGAAELVSVASSVMPGGSSSSSSAVVPGTNEGKKNELLFHPLFREVRSRFPPGSSCF